MLHEDKKETETVLENTETVPKSPAEEIMPKDEPKEAENEVCSISIDDVGKAECSAQNPIGNISATTKDGQLCDLSYNSNTIEGDFGSLNFSANIDPLNQSSRYNVSTDYTKRDFKLTAGFSQNKSYYVDGTYQVKSNNGFNGTLSLHKDNDDQFVSFSGCKAFNPDNINDTNDTYKSRKEELLSSDRQFSFEQKTGYKRDTGLYHDSSLMYKINNDNVLNSNFSVNSYGNSVTFGADLKKGKVRLFSYKKYK